MSFSLRKDKHSTGGQSGGVFPFVLELLGLSSYTKLLLDFLINNVYVIYMKKWNQLQSTINIITRLANQTLRAQKLFIAQRLQQTEEMIKIHRSTIIKQPNGEKKFKQITQNFSKARRCILKDKKHG